MITPFRPYPTSLPVRFSWTDAAEDYGTCVAVNSQLCTMKLPVVVQDQAY